MKLFFFLLYFATLPLYAEPLPVKLGAFIDTYYAFDSNTQKDHEREYTTQPARHNEFNVNLAYIDAVWKKEKTRGRLALQYGNSVTKNYSGERTAGSTSGETDDARHLQEAFAGARIGEKTWIDLGIFLGNIGNESWISKNNWTYTRALNLDYVPYYSSGVRLEHFFNDEQSIQLQLLNGWQNISETNQGKAIGMQYRQTLDDRWTFTYNNFLGDEEVVEADRSLDTDVYNSRFRSYHNFMVQLLSSDKWEYAAAFDVGHQAQQKNDGVDAWYATTLTIRRVLGGTQALAMRGEYYNDRHQANVNTFTPNGFQVISASVNFDQKLDDNALWRTEVRGFQTKDEIFPEGKGRKNRNDAFLVTSLGIWF